VSVWLIAKVMPINQSVLGGVVVASKGVRMMKISTSAHKNGIRPSLALTGATYALALATFAWLSCAHAQTGQVIMTCTNPSSGATWQIHIDYDRHTVDSNPAVISDGTIAWHESNGWKYSLDRKSGKLTVVLASSTGGNFLYDQCKLER